MNLRRFLPFIAIFALSTPFPASAQSEGNWVEAIFREISTESMSAEIKLSNDDVRQVSLGAGDAKIYEAGDSVRGELVPYGDGWRLQTIHPNAPEIRGTIINLGNRLRRETQAYGRKAFRSVGERMPRFALQDENADLFLSESLKGSYVVMNFIFTRCQMPTMCPAATERMHQLQLGAAEAGITDLILVSVTLDPDYDTPGIFTTYAENKGISTKNFHFLGGPSGIVEDLKMQMGVLSEPDEEQIIRHTMSTALVDPQGEIIYRVPGSMWDPKTFIREIEKDKAGS